MFSVRGFDPVYGARPLRRLIQTAIENPISIQIISKAFVSGDTILVDYDDAKQEYIFKKGAAAPASPVAGQTLNEGVQVVGQQSAPVSESQVNPQVQQVPQQQASPVVPPQNGMITDPYAQVQNPMTPPPFNPYTASGMEMSAQPDQPAA